MNRRHFLAVSAAAATVAAAPRPRSPWEREVGLVAATLGAHQSHRKKGGIALADLPKVIRQELGMKVIDMNTMNFAKLDLKSAEILRQSAERENCVLTNLKLNQRDLDLASPNAATRQRALDVFRGSIDAAKLMGMKWVRPLPRPQQGDRKLLIGSLRELDEYAGERGLRVLVENFGWMQSDPNSVVDLIRDVGRDQPASPDTGNWSNNEVRYAGLKKTFPLAATCDYKAKTFNAKGEHVQYDLEKCFRIGWDAGFRGPWCIEHGHRDLNQLYKNLRRIKGMLEDWMKSG